MFCLEKVAKVYRKRQSEVYAFGAEKLYIGHGEYVAVVGSSGSGKTTLMSILGGMLSPDSGQVLLDGVSLYGLSVVERTRIRRERIGFVFQTFNLLPYLSALENVQMPLFLARTPASAQRSRAAALLERLGLGDRMDHKPGELSTGQQQRVALARTLANDPSLILADEPTGNLDPESREHVLRIFDEFVSEGRTVVMVTHDRTAASRSARQIRLDAGRIVSDSLSDGKRAA